MEINQIPTEELLADLEDYAASIAVCNIYLSVGLLADFNGQTPQEYKETSEKMKDMIVGEVLRRCGEL